MTTDKSAFSTWLRFFFSNYLWLGVVVILLSIVLDQQIPEKGFALNTTLDLLKSIGVAIVVASIFTFASGTSEFIEKIRTLLQDIVVSRNFLGNIDSESKRDALCALIKPSNEEKKIYSNIEDYFNTYINQTMDVTRKCVRSNYNINARAYIDKDHDIVVVESIISYRLYPTLEGYSDIKVGFYDNDKHSTCEYITVNTPHGDRKIHDNLVFEPTNTDIGKARLANINLSSYSKSCTHLDIELKMKEFGKDHWILLAFQALQPTDGFKHYIRCEGELEINDYATFVHGAKFYVEKKNNNEMSTSCNEWINEGTGISMVISLPKSKKENAQQYAQARRASTPALSASAKSLQPEPA